MISSTSDVSRPVDIESSFLATRSITTTSVPDVVNVRSVFFPIITIPNHLVKFLIFFIKQIHQ